MKLDWISATLPDGYPGSPIDLLAPLGNEAPRLVRGIHGYNRGHEIRLDGSTLATIYEGPGMPPHIRATGSDAAPVGRLLRSTIPGLRIARADVATDYLGGRRLFTDLRDTIRLRVAGKVSTRYLSGVSARGEVADTLYVGSKNSETMLRLYEKGKEDPTYDPETVRVELQVRPNSPDRKVYAGTLDPSELWGFSKWSREIAGDLLSVDAPAAPVRSDRVSDLDRSLDVMTFQYRNRLIELLELLNGDLGALGADLMARVDRIGSDDET